ncbi:tetraacyldisaccharide 4'-kinase [Halovulum sp. GXIMD14793]
MQAPKFWQNPPDQPGIAARCLSPLSAVWAMATRRRVSGQSTRVAGLKVICVGNLTAGGTGKTPLVCELVQRLQASGQNVHILSRGYGGKAVGPLRVDPQQHDAAHVGDEPLLLANYAPVWVSRDRVAGAEAAREAGADLLVMDDGFQNPGLVKDLSILVVDAEAGFGNGCVIPAGPLREPVSEGLKRADLVVAVGPDQAAKKLLSDWPQLGQKELITGQLRPLSTGMDWTALRLFAFAGIGRPEKFFATLAATGADIAATRSFADHAAYDRRIMDRLRREATEAKAQLVTTEKDLVRLPADQRSGILPFPVRLELNNPEKLDHHLSRIASGRVG